MNSNGRGFVFGAAEDGTIYYRQKKAQYNIEIEQKIRQWLEIVKDEIETTYNFHAKISVTSKGYFRLTVVSKALHNEIVERRKNYYTILLESYDFQIGFLQGIFDAEGTVHNKRYSVRMASKKEAVILVVKELLERNKIKVGKIHYDKTAIVLPLYGKENLQLFKNVVGFRHQEKKDRLNIMIPDQSIGVVAGESSRRRS